LTTADPITDAAGNVTGYRLNGAKQFITNGGVAQLYTILAKAPGGPSFFIVERGTPGLEVGKKEDKHGIRASNTTGVLLEDVEVPLDQLIGGEEGIGLKQANAVFGYTRLMVGAFGLGGGQAALGRALAYARTREQFGGPLLDKEGFLLKLIAPHWIDLAAGRAYIEEVALQIDSGDRDKAVEGSVAKLWCTEAGNRAADAALQALGGYGYAREYMVEKFRRDVRITSIYEGTSEIQQSIIGLFRWKALVRSKGTAYDDEAAALEAVHAARDDVGAGLAAAALRGAAAAVMAAHAGGHSRHQRVQFCFADLATRAEVAAAFARKAARLAEAGAADAPALAAMSRVFARQALTAVATEARECVAGFAAGEDESAEAEADALASRILAGAPAGQRAGLWTDMAEVGEHLKLLV
jgi:alkylation response protein AidB-like acyl-CoA dehydrogenase